MSKNMQEMLSYSFFSIEFFFYPTRGEVQVK
jgi:hypothetical protein